MPEHERAPAHAPTPGDGPTARGSLLRTAWAHASSRAPPDPAPAGRAAANIARDPPAYGGPHPRSHAPRCAGQLQGEALPMPKSSAPSRGPRKLIGVLATIVAVVIGIMLISALDKTAGGEIAVVRNGGPLDNNQVRQVVDPASSLTYTGLFSQVHKYPAQQRFYTITATGGGDRGGVDVEHDPTSDGVEVGIEGTTYFTLTNDHDALAKFDDKYGTRTYLGVDHDAHAAWDGDD